MKPLNIILLFGLVLLTGCLNDEIDTVDSEVPVFLNLQVRAAGSINEDKVLGEDRVTEVRMIVFDLGGDAVYNDMLTFSNGIENACDPVALKPNTYNFYFFANESVDSDLSAALSEVTSLALMHQDVRFRHLVYNPAFHPDLTTPGGRFAMSAIYENIRVLQGGTEDDPLPLALPTGKVELIRTLSKVEIVFAKKTPGSAISAANRIASVGIANVAQFTDIPTMNEYYTTEPVLSSPVLTPTSGLEGFNYSQDTIGKVTFYIPEYLNAPGSAAARFTQLDINNRQFPILTDGARVGLVAQRRNVAVSDSSIIRNYHYRIIVNISAGATPSIYIETQVVPWKRSKYSYMFQDEDTSIDLPPVEPTNPGIIIPVPCQGGQKVEIRYNNEALGSGLMGAFGDLISYYDSRVGGPLITNPNGFVKSKTAYCEKLYGPGWRFINSCELMAFFAIFDQAHRVFESNTWQGRGSNLPFYTKVFRQQAADLLSQLSGVNVTAYKNSMANATIK